MSERYLEHVTMQSFLFNSQDLLTVEVEFNDHCYTELCMWDGPTIPEGEGPEPAARIGFMPEDLEPLIDALIRVYDDVHLHKNYARKEVQEQSK